MMDRVAHTGLAFQKMHGIGNDFVILDARSAVVPLTSELASALSDRHTGVGADLICLIENHPEADARLSFFNADGSPSAACGNASRCVALKLEDEDGPADRSFVTDFGRLEVRSNGAGHYSVNMGQPATTWADIPLVEDLDLDALPIDGAPAAAGMGNPHMVFLVDDADAVDPAERGPALEHHPLYPERTNVEFCSIKPDGSIRMRVWERGVGVTMACGSGACAVVVAFARQGKVPRKTQVHLDGGTLDIDWRDDGVWMTGPATHVFDGTLDIDRLLAK